MVSLRPVRPYGLFVLPDRALLVLAGGAAHRPLAVRAVADGDPRECPSHARDRCPGRPPPARHLHDLGGAGRHFRGTDGADDAIRQPQLSFERSGTVLIMLIIGGVGQLYGAFIGVPLCMVAQNRFSEIDPVYWYFWIGLLMVVVVVFARGGVLGLFDRFRR